MLKQSVKFILAFLICIVLSSCDTTYKCISADNFGQFKEFAILATKNVEAKIGTYPVTQTNSWVDSGQIVSGSEDLIIIVKNTSGDSVSHWFHDQAKYVKGAGLYMLLTSDDPNVNVTKMSNPVYQDEKSKIYHLGCDSDSGATCPTYNGEPAGGIVVPAEEAQRYGGKKIYFKIVDSFYEMNKGGYQLVLRSGFQKDINDPIALLTKHVEDHVKKATRTVYEGIRTNIDYVLILQALLIVYIAFYGLLFTMGMIKGTTGEFVLMCTKVGIVVAVISEQSWNFFNNHLYTVFLDGVLSLASIMVGYSGNAGGVFGDILTSIANDGVFNKIVGIIFTDFGVGLLFFIIFGICVIILAFAVGYAALIYCLSYLAIGFLISIAPFFIPFVLFKRTFQSYIIGGWLKVLIANFMQIIIILSFYGFFRDVVLDQFKRNLGFPVCWVRIGGTDLIPLYNWKVQITPIMRVIDIPSYYFDPYSNVMCKPYRCRGFRYIDLPFLIPSPARIKAIGGDSMLTLNGDSLADEGDRAKRGWWLSYQHDQDLIDYFLVKQVPKSEEGGTLLFMVVIFYFASFIVSTIAKQLSGMAFSYGSGGGIDIVDKMGQGAFKLAAVDAANAATKAASFDLHKRIAKGGRKGAMYVGWMGGNSWDGSDARTFAGNFERMNQLHFTDHNGADQIIDKDQLKLLDRLGKADLAQNEYNKLEDMLLAPSREFESIRYEDGGEEIKFTDKDDKKLRLYAHTDEEKFDKEFNKYFEGDDNTKFEKNIAGNNGATRTLRKSEIRDFYKSNNATDFKNSW